MNSTRNTYLLLAFLLLVVGGGYYVTEVYQPAALQHLEDMNRVARSQQGEVAQLLAEAEVSADRAEMTLRKWKARYRYVPTALTTPDIVEYLEPHTSRGLRPLTSGSTGCSGRPT